MSILHELLQNLQAILIVGVIGGLPIFFMWWHGQLPGPLLPRQRRRAVPWTWAEILLAFFCTHLLVPGLVMTILLQTSIYPWLTGEMLPTSDGHAGKNAQDARFSIWVQTLSFPLQLGLLLAVVCGMAKAQLFQLGLTMHRLRQNVTVGWFGWLIATPVVLLVFAAVLHVQALWSAEPPDEHPLSQLMRQGPRALEWLIVFLSPVIAAPIIEEVLFRGVLQPWLVRSAAGRDIMPVFCLVVALVSRLSGLEKAWDLRDWQRLLHELEPALFVLILFPVGRLGAPLFVRQGKLGMASAIHSSSLFFAACHSSVWPSPIPLYLLALCLGYLAYRTQSLIGPITMHALFNLVAWVGLMRIQGA